MYNVFLVANLTNGTSPVADALSRAGITCRQGVDLAPLENEQVSPQLEAVLMDLSTIDLGRARLMVDRCKKLRLPVLAVVARDKVAEFDPSLNTDELIVHPVPEGELLLRVKQAIYRVSGPTGSQMVKARDLTIDLERYDVTVVRKRVSLTYKEFQLLVLLASNPGRVYSRERLLSQF